MVSTSVDSEYMVIELIRKRIETCGKTRYRISQETGVSEAQLCRVMQGKTITIETAEVLLRYFGFEVVQKKSKARKRQVKNGKRNK